MFEEFKVKISEVVRQYAEKRHEKEFRKKFPEEFLEMDKLAEEADYYEKVQWAEIANYDSSFAGADAGDKKRVLLDKRTEILQGLRKEGYKGK